MTRLLAEDLLLLCWDEERGRVAATCSSTIGPGIGGALLLDAVLADALEVVDGRVRPGTTASADPLLQQAVESVGRRRRPPKASSAVSRLGTGRLVRQVTERLVETGLLRREERRVLGLFPVTRHQISDVAAVDELRQRTKALLLGITEPGEVTVHDAALAALSGPTKALDRLVERGDRKAARKRAEGFAEGQGLPKAVADAIASANAAAMAAITAATASAAASSSSSQS